MALGRVMGDIAEWLRKKREAKDNTAFARGYLAAIDAWEKRDAG
jgi:hypothetical protein